MQVQSLAGAWEFRESGTEAWHPAKVPGCVHTDLLALERIPDPFYRDNEADVRWVADRDWVYRTTFTPSDALLNEARQFLVADGIDTLSRLILNGTAIGDTDNQHRAWEWDITDLLREDGNILEVQFTSPTQAATAKQAARPMTTVAAQLPGAPHLRKAPYQFGWDWGPKLPTCGIWKDLRLEGRSVARLSDVRLEQIHEGDSVSVRASASVDAWVRADLTLELSIENPEGMACGSATTSIEHRSGSIALGVADPRLWWPNGFGDQPLYRVRLRLLYEGCPIDETVLQVGLRTLELRREPDEWGESFQFIVNGVPIFAKGSNWIPPDAFVDRVDEAKLGKLISDAAATHQNMLRIWGGGTYGSDRLYDLCDRYGILVWQDFMFSCSVYPLDDAAFVSTVRAEVEDNVRRIRHRPSLALLCGNNEMDQGWESWGWAKSPAEDALNALAERFASLRPWIQEPDASTRLPDWPSLQDGYTRFFYETLPDWTSELAPDIEYWPSSPTSRTPFENANGQEMGDAHYWEVWHGRKPFSAFRDCLPRFMSEFGFQAFPTLETVDAYTEAEDRNLVSRVMELHQRGNHGNGLIIAQMTDTFRMPESFPGWIYLSLILQAEGIRYGVEHWRRNRQRVGGALYWQLDDCWPVASWSSIDYYGRWKALHYAARRFYAPVLLSVLDDGCAMELHITNDRAEAWAGAVRWGLETLQGDAIESDEISVMAAPVSDTSIVALDFTDAMADKDPGDHILVCELLQGEERIALSVHPFLPSKHLDLDAPQIESEVSEDGDGVRIRLQAASLARFVELKLAGAPDVVFSDNYFDLPAGREVVITCDRPEGRTVEQVKNALSVYSLVDSYAAR